MTNPSKLLIFQRSKSSANVRRWLANVRQRSRLTSGVVGQRSAALPPNVRRCWPTLPSIARRRSRPTLANAPAQCPALLANIAQHCPAPLPPNVGQCSRPMSGAGWPMLPPNVRRSARRWLANVRQRSRPMSGVVGQRSPALPGIAPAQRWPMLPQRYTAFCGVAGSVV
jgi:hypothetical protein